MNEVLLFSFPFLRIVLISWWSLFISRLTIILFCEWISQILSWPSFVWCMYDCM